MIDWHSNQKKYLACFPLCQIFRKFIYVSISISSDRNTRDHLWRWSTYFGRNIPNKIRRSICQTDSLPYFSSIPLGWPGLIKKCSSVLLEYSHLWSLRSRSGIMESTPSLVSEQEFGSFNHHQQLTIVCYSFGRLGKKERAGSAILPKIATKATSSLNQRKGKQSCGTIIFWIKTQVYKCVQLSFAY